MIVNIFQKGDQQDCNNYRPISLLWNIGKVIEKLILKRLLKFLNNNYYLFNYQFGFRNHHSTNHGLISITEKIWIAIDNGKIACGAFLNFQNHFAFMSCFYTWKFPIILGSWFFFYKFMTVYMPGLFNWFAYRFHISSP